VYYEKWTRLFEHAVLFGVELKKICLLYELNEFKIFSICGSETVTLLFDIEGQIYSFIHLFIICEQRSRVSKYWEGQESLHTVITDEVRNRYAKTYGFPSKCDLF